MSAPDPLATAAHDSAANRARAGESNPELAATSGAMGAKTAEFLIAAAGDASPPPTWAGRTIGKYQVSGVLGQGGMGVVLKARDPLIERDVAIKVLLEHLASDEASIGRFFAEARAAGKLHHPNVIAIYDVGQEEKLCFLVLEFVGGGSLSGELKSDRGMSLVAATGAMIDACRGVGAAHAAGLIHRDLKPANLMRATDGSVKVADFGLAKSAFQPGREFTQSGKVVGTPFYMSPEQCEARPPDARSDVYALGATYYCLLTGRHPYHGTESIPQVMYLHCHGPIPDPRERDATIPEACAAIVARAMAKDPAARYQSTAEMQADLQAVAATLSGQVPIALPSRSGSNPALTPLATASTTSAAAAKTSPNSSADVTQPAGFNWLYGVGGAALLVLLGLVAFFFGPGRGAAGPVAPTGEPVLVGVLHSLSGTMAGSEAAVADAVYFAIDEVNAEGGVLGRPVKAITADSRSDDGLFASEAERLIAQEKVNAIFGCWNSSSRKMVRPVVEKHDHLLMYPLQFEGLETSPCVFYLGAAPNQQILPAIEWATKTLGKKRVFLVGSDSVFPRATSAIVQDQVAGMGVEIVGDAYLPTGSQDVKAIVDAIVAAKPDLILNSLAGDSNISFFRALRKAGITADKTPTISFRVSEQGLRSLNPSEVAGDYFAYSYFQSLDLPENKAFLEKFHARFPNRTATNPMVTAYLAVKLWAQAANEAGSVEPKKVRRALLNRRMTGPAGEIRIDADTQYCDATPRIGQMEMDGSVRVVWTAPQPVAPNPFPASRSAEGWNRFLHDLSTGWGGKWSAPEMP